MKRKRPPLNIRCAAQPMTETEEARYRSARDAFLLAFVRHAVARRVSAESAPPKDDTPDDDADGAPAKDVC